MRETNQAPTFFGTMVKSLRNSLFLIIAALLLTACPKKQGPTPSGNATGGGIPAERINGEFIPDGDGSGDWGMDGGDLADLGRDSGDMIANGMYGEYTMVENVLPSVFFGFDSSAISGTERSKLQQAANYLADNPNEKLLLEGHCDWYGTAEYNLALGDRRAISARDYLITLGVQADRVETLSKGSLESTGGLSKTESSQDRRADVIVLRK